MPRALLFGWNDHLLLEVLRCLGSGAITTHVLGAHLLPPVRFSRYCERYERLPPLPAGRELSELLTERCRGAAFDVVVPADADAVRFLSGWEPPSGVAKFPVPPAELVDLANDKWLFTQRCIELGVTVPKTRRVDTPDALRALAGQVPFFVKPVVGTFSEGAARIASTPDIDAYLRRERWRPLLVQDFIPGEDVDVSVLCEDGKVLAWTSQRCGGSALERRIQPETGAVDEVRKAVAGLKWNGLAHFDLRHDPRDGSFKVLELNPRFWFSVMFSTWAGVNFATLGIYQALGMTLSVPQMQAGVYQRPLLRLGTLLSAVSPTGTVARRAWVDPMPQAWTRFQGLARTLRR